jgi:hypothetical protein
MSAEDIDAGTRWGIEVTNQLAETRCGIICLTKDNQQAPWILFEAGALSKTIDKTYVIPYLIDLEPSDILPGPLTQFQAKRANKSETWELVRTLNGALDTPLSDDQLKRGFERCWQELETALKDLPEPTSHTETRSSGDMLVEVLDEVRGISRMITGEITPRLDLQGKLIVSIADSTTSGMRGGARPGQSYGSDPSIVRLIANQWRAQSGSVTAETAKTIIKGILREEGAVDANEIVLIFNPEYAEMVMRVIKEMHRDGTIHINKDSGFLQLTSLAEE